MVDDFWVHLFDCLLAFLWNTYRRARDAFESYENLYTQHAILDSAYNQVQNQYKALKKRHDDLNDLVNILPRALHELEGNQEMLSDQLEGVHYGLVMLGRYSNHSELNPQQRQYVCIQCGCSCAQQILCIGGGKYLECQRSRLFCPLARRSGTHFKQHSWTCHGHCTRMKRTKRDCSHRQNSWTALATRCDSVLVST